MISTAPFTSFAQSKDVVDIAISSADHITLVAAVKAADLVATLKSAGPFTVNAAFSKLPDGTVANFVKTRKQSNFSKDSHLPCF